MAKKFDFELVPILFTFSLIVAGIGGWVANIVKIINSDFELTGMMIARVIGVFLAPLGAVLGYC